MEDHEIDFTLGTLTGEGKLKEHFNEEKDCHEYTLKALETVFNINQLILKHITGGN